MPLQHLAWNRGWKQGYCNAIMRPLFFVPSLLRPLLFWLAVVAAMPVVAQDKVVPAGPPLAAVKDVQAMGVKEIEVRPRQVQLKGVVLYVNTKRDDFKLHDGERSIGVSLPDGAERPKVGDRVEVAGFTDVLSVQEHQYPHIHGETMRVTGSGELPRPSEVSMTALVEFKNYDQWVSTEGVVLMWTYKAPKLSLLLMGPDNLGVVHVQAVPQSSLPVNLHGASVRVTGVNMGVSHSMEDTLIAPSPAQLEILKPGTQDVFDAPAVSVEDVASRNLPLLERVKVKGVVTARIDDRILYVRDGRSSICALILHGWLRSSGAGQIYGDAGRVPDIKPGDEVELVGSMTSLEKDARRANCSLVWCHVRVTGHHNSPAPVETTLPAIAGGAHSHELVKVQARLLHMDQVPVAKAEWRTTMMVEADGLKLPVCYQGRNQQALYHLKVDDDLVITGVIDKATTYDPRLLWVTSPESVRSLGLSKSVQEHRFWFWGSIAAAAILVLGFWIVSLRASMKRRAVADAMVRELNASLERRVAERTEALEQAQAERTEVLEKAQAELRKALEHERELGELKSRFVTTVSHEFRTPLGIIMSAVELMRHYEERLPQEQRRELCEDIYNATRLMGGLMEQVLVLGRVEAGKLGRRTMPLDLNTLAEKITDEMLSATDRRCPIHWLPKGSLEGAVGDESLLRHIFSNLITNAVKYSATGIAVEFTAYRDGTAAVFQVIDRGIGIPLADQGRLFEAFYRCSNVGEIPGTGLGLVIVKRCVDLHGGTLQLDSQPGRGTTFTVRLPLFVPA